MVAAFLFRQFPPGVVQPHIENLGNGIDGQAGKQHPGRVGEQGLEGRHGPVGGRSGVQQPGLGNDQEQHGGEDAHHDRPVGGLFPLVFRQDVRDQEGHGKQHIAQGLLHTEGVDDDHDLDIGQNGGHGVHGIQAVGAEQAVGQQGAAIDHDQGQNQQKFIAHWCFLLFLPHHPPEKQKSAVRRPWQNAFRILPVP